MHITNEKRGRNFQCALQTVPRCNYPSRRVWSTDVPVGRPSPKFGSKADPTLSGVKPNEGALRRISVHRRTVSVYDRHRVVRSPAETYAKANIGVAVLSHCPFRCCWGEKPLSLSLFFSNSPERIFVKQGVKAGHRRAGIPLL